MKRSILILIQSILSIGFNELSSQIVIEPEFSSTSMDSYLHGAFLHENELGYIFRRDNDSLHFHVLDIVSEQVLHSLAFGNLEDLGSDGPYGDLHFMNEKWNLCGISIKPDNTEIELVKVEIQDLNSGSFSVQRQDISGFSASNVVGTWHCTKTENGRLVFHGLWSEDIFSYPELRIIATDLELNILSDFSYDLDLPGANVLMKYIFAEVGDQFHIGTEDGSIILDSNFEFVDEYNFTTINQGGEVSYRTITTSAAEGDENHLYVQGFGQQNLFGTDFSWDQKIFKISANGVVSDSLFISVPNASEITQTSTLALNEELIFLSAQSSPEFEEFGSFNIAWSNAIVFNAISANLELLYSYELNLPQAEIWLYKTLLNDEYAVVSGHKRTQSINAKWDPVFVKFDLNELGLSISEADTPSGSNLHVLPNPTSDLIRVALPKTESGSYNITDLAGRNIFKESFTLQNQLQINAQGLPSGAYVLQIRGQNGNLRSTRFIKQ